jgi:hypothetical protein
VFGVLFLVSLTGMVSLGRTRLADSPGFGT